MSGEVIATPYIGYDIRELYYYYYYYYYHYYHYH
jgi:hypothetical protein